MPFLASGSARPGCSRADRRGDLHPAKQRPEQKIDVAVAPMMAVGRAVAEETGGGDIEAFLHHAVIAWWVGPSWWPTGTFGICRFSTP